MQHWTEIATLVIVQIFMVVGLVGLIIPIYPGTVIMWLAALGYGIVTGFSTIGIVIFVIMTILMLISTVADNLMLGMGARKGGASWWTIGIALFAGIIGTIALPPFGGIIAAPLVVLIIEYFSLGDWQKAWQVLRGMATGWGLSFIVRFGLGLIILILSWVWAWLD